MTVPTELSVSTPLGRSFCIVLQFFTLSLVPASVNIFCDASRWAKKISVGVFHCHPRVLFSIMKNYANLLMGLALFW
jgi:hypothetical protein